MHGRDGRHPFFRGSKKQKYEKKGAPQVVSGPEKCLFGTTLVWTTGCSAAGGATRVNINLFHLSHLLVFLKRSGAEQKCTLLPLLSKLCDKIFFRKNRGHQNQMHTFLVRKHIS